MNIFERAIHIQVNSYLKRICVLCEERSGFQEGHSIVTAVTDVTDFIYKNIDQAQLTSTVFLEIKRHLTLKCLGINNTKKLWLLNYLIDRVQCVSFFCGYITGMICFMWCSPGVHPGSPQFFLSFI